MPTRLQDPQYSSRWKGWGAVGRWTSQGPVAPNQAAPPPPIREDYAYQDPYASTKWPSWEEQQERKYAKAENEKIEGWNYEDPPVNDQGVALGPNGEELPEDAFGFTPYGEAYYGEGLQGWWRGVQSRWKAPVEEAIPWDDLHAKNHKRVVIGGVDVGEVALADFDEMWTAIEGTWHNVSRFGQVAGDKANVFTLTGRAVEETIGGVFTFLDGAGKLYEWGVGTANLTLKETAEGSPLPEWKETNFPDWSPDWMETIESYGAANPLLAGYNLIRTVAKPGSQWEEIKQGWDEHNEVGKIAYTAWKNPAIIAEFQRKYKQGKDPALIAMELEEPITEMIGRMIFDPLNIVEFATGAVVKGIRNGKLLKEFVDVGDTVSDVLKLDHASDAAAAAKVQQLAAAQMDTAKKIAQGYDKLARDRSLFQLTTEGKRYSVNRRVGALTAWIGSNSDDPDEALEIFQALAKMHSSNPDDVAEGVATAMRWHAPRPLFARSGQETGAVLAKMMTYEDEFNPLRFLDEMNAARKKGPKAVMSLMEKAQTSAVDNLFPTLLDSPQANEISPLVKNFARLDKAVKNRLYLPINTIFSHIYMGMSPGFAMRNMLTNSTHIVFDVGFTGLKTAYGQGTLFNPKAWAGIAKDFLGHVPAAMVEGMGGPGIAAAEIGAKAAGKWYSPFLTISEGFEVAAAHRVAGHAIYDTMIKGLRPGRAIPVTDNLVKAGMSEASAHLLVESVLEAKGDIPKAVANFRASIADGQVRVKDTMAWLDRDSIEALHGGKIYDDVVEAVKSDDLETAIQKLDDIYEDWWTEAKATSKEIPVTGEHTENATVKSALQAAADENPALARSARRRHWQMLANENAIQAGYEVMQDLRGDMVVAMKQAQANGDAEQLAALRNVWDRFTADLGLDPQKSPGLHAVVKEESREFMDNAWRQYEYMKGLPAGHNWNAWWKDLGTGIEAPAGLSKAEARQMFWELHVFPSQDKMWRDFTSVWVGSISNYMDEAVTAGLVYDMDGPLVATMKAKYTQALDMPDWVPVKNIWTRMSVMMRAALDRDDVDSAIRILAHKYGIGSISLKGASTDNWVNNVLRKYDDTITTPNATKSKVFGVTLEDARRIFENQRAAKLGENYTPLIESFEKIGLTAAKRYIPRDADVPQVVRQIMAGMDLSDADWRKAGTWARKHMDEAARQAYDERSARLVELDVIFKNNPVESQDDALIMADEIAELTDLRHQQEVAISKALDNAKVPSELPEEFTTFIPPHDSSQIPTPPRMAAESLEGLKAELAKIKKRLSDVWNETQPAMHRFDMPLEDELARWTGEARENVAELRLMAEQTGAAARKFALHNYPEKRNFDLALGYIYPYQFWYSRTYKNWLTRMVRNPGKLQAYVDYREAMEKIHAGSPDFWKYNINTDELLGLDTGNPLFFNLEATLNPLNGLTGVDFNDPRKRVNWWTNVLDDLNKFGPSVWTPLSVATAVGLLWQGEKDAAARWGNRLIPQTATIKSLAGLAGHNLELDPAVWAFSGGADPYERRRIGRALAAMVQNGEISAEQAMDAGWSHSGPIWEQAQLLATQKRAPGQLGSFFLGVGFKGRRPEDVQIDEMYQDYYGLWAQRGNLSSQEFRQSMEQLRVTYPFMDTVLLARRAGPERDVFMAYNVLSRIPPGSSGEFTKLAGIDRRLVSQFYDSKGDMSQWAKQDRDRFVAGITDLAAILALPPQATREEWTAARNQYSLMMQTGEQLFGEDIWERVDRYYAAKGASEDNEIANQILEANPIIGQALDWKQQVIFNDPLLGRYYGGIEQVEQYYKSLKRQEIELKFGDDIWDVQSTYFMLKEQDEAAARQFLKDNPQLQEKWDYSRARDEDIDAALERLDGVLPEGQPAVLRQDMGNVTLFQEDIAQAIQPEPQVSWAQWQSVLSPQEERLLVDFFTGETLNGSVEARLDAMAEQLGISTDRLIEEMEQSYFGSAP